MSLKWNIDLLNLLPAGICGQSYYKQGLTQVSRHSFSPLCDSKLVSVQFTLVACLRDFFKSKYSMTLHGFQIFVEKGLKIRCIRQALPMRCQSLSVQWVSDWKKIKSFEIEKHFRNQGYNAFVHSRQNSPMHHSHSSMSLSSLFVKLNNVIFLNKWKYVNLLIRVSL